MYLHNTAVMMDMPKLHSPYVREKTDLGYVVTNEVAPGYEWVFDCPDVVAVEKLNGTNVSVLMNQGSVQGIWNRVNCVPFINKGKEFIIEGVQKAYARKFLAPLTDGQHFGELIGVKLAGNPHNIDGHLFVPFSRLFKTAMYKSWHMFDHNYEEVSEWMRTIPSLFGKTTDSTYMEGVVFYHPDGKRMAKLRLDMFDWYSGKCH